MEIARNAAAARWTKLPKLLRPLLWEHAVEEYRLPEKRDVVLVHVLAFGTDDQVNWARRRFGDKGIAEWLRRRDGWGIDRRRLHRWMTSAALHEGVSKGGPLTGRDAPEAVRRLLKTYQPAALLWADPDHRYAIVREVLVRGDQTARAWLAAVMASADVRTLVKEYRGAGCSEPERQRLRTEFGLSTEDIPVRPGLDWP